MPESENVAPTSPLGSLSAALRAADIPGTVTHDPCILRASPVPLLYIGIPVEHAPALAARLTREPER
ncbi:hypothetical protein [Streptomyces antimycoticus]|uniref:hypothetical protein n=1 Tax=Streptomyces antimycoticus TaxID=68175 RepID=UPI0036ED07BD